MTSKEDKALRVLRSCERGATVEAMKLLHGIDQKYLDRLVQKGKLGTRVQRLDKPRLDVRWYFIKRD